MNETCVKPIVFSFFVLQVHFKFLRYTVYSLLKYSLKKPEHKTFFCMYAKNK